MRHADAGYEDAIACAREHALDLPGLGSHRKKGGEERHNGDSYRPRLRRRRGKARDAKVSTGEKRPTAIVGERTAPPGERAKAKLGKGCRCQVTLEKAGASVKPTVATRTGDHLLRDFRHFDVGDLRIASPRVASTREGGLERLMREQNERQMQVLRPGAQSLYDDIARSPDRHPIRYTDEVFLFQCRARSSSYSTRALT